MVISNQFKTLPLNGGGAVTSKNGLFNFVLLVTYLDNTSVEGGLMI